MDLFRWYFKKLKGAFEVFPGCIKFHVTDGVFAVSGFHVTSFVVVGSAWHESDELLLPDSEFFHVGIRVVMSHSLVLEHGLIKFVDNCADGISTSQSLIKGHFNRIWINNVKFYW